ncbi:DsbA family oxidoreductase [Desemzia sp. RIT804]|uniref:DsbA family oxidoreductase n=1 Tax=Desemzia sp. RIT 804 TaxID=2810209 RepID=UPI00195003A1|nr:DsbA family oxidoreductase [Desemzia sp. RIT 804]MBM6614450.1 DsbA family oxidoreductase [Desemzia sp. RIT 804]
MKIDIWSDFVCPFCYIGKRHIEEAAKEIEDITFEYHSYELDPTAPEKYDGSIQKYFAEIKGMSAAQADDMIHQVTTMANNAGLDYHYEKVRHGNTVKPHRLFQYAKTQGKGNEFMEVAKEAYFINGEWLNGDDTLLELAEKIGLDKEASTKVLQSDDYLEAMRQDIATAQQIGVQGVPFFVIDGKYGVSGAQPVDTFKQVLKDVQEQNA